MTPTALKKLRLEVAAKRAAMEAEAARLRADLEATLKAMREPVFAAERDLEAVEVVAAADALSPEVATAWLSGASYGPHWKNLVQRQLATSHYYSPHTLTPRGAAVLALIQKRAAESKETT